ncbi:MAG: hypothetical protein ACLP66_24285 [Polyangia bacterium]
MPRTCTICKHSNRHEIDQALVSGCSFRDVARQYETSPSAVHRHRSHILPAVAEAKQATDDAHADSLRDQLHGLVATAHRIGQAAEAKHDLKTALAAVRELTRLVELTARMRGELPAQPVSVTVAPPKEMTLEEAAEILKSAPALAKRAQELGLFSEGKTSPPAGGPTLSIAK